MATVLGGLLSTSDVQAQCETRPYDGTDFVVDTNALNMCGDIIAPHITIAGTLTVADFETDDPNSGWVHLRAGVIRIEATGRIEAAAAGYEANDLVPTNISISGPGAGSTPNPSFPDANDPRPGGGGSHSGAGIAGLWGADWQGCTSPGNGCELFPEAAAGPTYDLDASNPLALQSPQLGMGSAGGGSHTGSCATTPRVQRGGHGGGVVLLTAYRIELAGTIIADGASANPEQGGTLFASGPGGGAGGSIIIRSRELQLSSPSLSARGGDGGFVESLTIGGPGGGGLIVVMGPSITNSDLTDLTNVTGGSNGSACNQSGSPGLVAALPAPSCIDADLDGNPHEACGGTDCEDGRPDVPGDPVLAEVCNGIDDDCNQVVDGPDALCNEGSGLVCENSECVVPGSGGTGGSADDGFTVELRGGICASSAGRLARFGPLAWLALVAMLGLGCRRRR